MTCCVLRVPGGAWLLQTAAGSTLGRMVIRLAQHRGFRTVNIVRRETQIGELKALGADVCISSPSIGELWLVPNYTDEDRRELSVADAATLTAVCAALPGAQVVSFKERKRRAENPDITWPGVITN